MDLQDAIQLSKDLSSTYFVPDMRWVLKVHEKKLNHVRYSVIIKAQTRIKILWKDLIKKSYKKKMEENRQDILTVDKNHITWFLYFLYRT